MSPYITTAYENIEWKRNELTYTIIIHPHLPHPILASIITRFNLHYTQALIQMAIKIMSIKLEYPLVCVKFSKIILTKIIPLFKLLYNFSKDKKKILFYLYFTARYIYTIFHARTDSNIVILKFTSSLSNKTLNSILVFPRD